MELLVSMLLSTMVLAIVTRDFSFNVHTRDDMDLTVETQHAAQSALTFLTQELRQAGACMPDLGDFIALEGSNDGDRDELTLRIGIADPDTLQCSRTILNRRADRNTSEMRVESTQGFEVGQWIYVIKSTGHGNFFKVADISGLWITIDGTFDVNYPKNSGVYAIEERSYAIQEVNGTPSLMVSIDGDDPIPMVRGIDALDVRYKMAPCPPCESVALPSSQEQWRVVREVDVSVTARSARPGHDGEHELVTQSAAVKPRNLL